MSASKPTKRGLNLKKEKTRAYSITGCDLSPFVNVFLRLIMSQFFFFCRERQKRSFEIISDVRRRLFRLSVAGTCFSAMESETAGSGQHHTTVGSCTQQLRH